MRVVQKDGSTARDHMEALVRQGRKKQEELDGPGIPDEVAYLWGWFRELEQTRDWGQAGPKALSYSEVDAWARLTGRSPQPHEVSGLMALDMAVRFPSEPDDED